METKIIQKYVRDLDGLKEEIASWKKKFELPKEEDWAEILPIYHDEMIFFFAILYKYLIFENIPIFIGKGLDAWIEHKGKKINVEFEVSSSEFMSTHSDDERRECDVLVCWEDNSRKIHKLLPHIDVMELRYFWETG